MRKVRRPLSATYTQLIESKLTTRNVSRLYGVPYKFADGADMFCYLLFIEHIKRQLLKNVGLAKPSRSLEEETFNVIEIDGNQLENVEKFTYLGCLNTYDLDSKKEILVRIAKAT